MTIFVRPDLPPIGTLPLVPRGDEVFEHPMLKKGGIKVTRKKSTEDHVVFVGGSMDGQKYRRRTLSGPKKTGTYFETFEPKTNPEHRVMGDRVHAGWYVYEPETDRMVWRDVEPRFQ